jgi:hypothetical protein
MVGSVEGVGERNRGSRPGEALDKERAWSANQIHRAQEKANKGGIGEETGHSLTGSSDASLLATLQNVLLQIGGALAVFTIPFKLEFPDASDEVLW